MNYKMLSRRRALKQLAAGCIAIGMPKVLFSQNDQIMKRAIPSTGEKIGVVGLGTWQTFDVGNSSLAREPLKAVLKALVDGGGNVVDSSPMYGSSEKVVGDLSAEVGLKKDLFYATKVWTSGKQSGIDQMQSSMVKMRTTPMDLMQIHNLQDWKTHIKTLYDWKER
ncbi:MAG: aldo/keto reductase, partial [Marinoscillum sp.]